MSRAGANELERVTELLREATSNLGDVDVSPEDREAAISAVAASLRDRRLRLAEDASVHRMRLLAAVDPAWGAAAARTYLERWPRGYARAEAQLLARRK